ncbi:PREDICTED: probable protein phosphatase 2C 23 [Erythranthe guttata]|uniref:probable protein phosphatase 2C 23 n=1 Tax=Erythranthe guttata TaxID=4155 RepID=UPI00064DFD37|nr:PREDICTED: probable protein phosphatase 2C 23 [Erythranthe guttata]|eukprot:XP_012850405.1 PREDICTED: probable protein phosphatase 2C 23 [Erythranthe guttata]
MGNGIGKLSICFAGDAGEISRRRNDVAVCSSDPLDEGLGHSFCYIPQDPLHKTQSLDDSSAAVAAPQNPAPFRTISGASISANNFTPLSTNPFPYNTSAPLDKASAFESSNFFSSIPLQPIPRNSFSTVKSGPILRSSVPGSGPIERGFLSGPIERSFISGPLENQFDHLQRYRPKSKKRALIKNLKRVMSKSFWGFSKESRSIENEQQNNVVLASVSNSGNSSTITSNTLSSDMSLIDENDDVGNESFGSQNVQWAQGKAGEDRVHVVISEEHGWVFVGIYDGFNGPDATDFLLNNLYSNVYKELKGLLWCEKSESCENTVNSSSFMSKSLDCKERVELDRKLREKLSNMDCNNNTTTATVNHLGVLKALSEALRKTEASYLEIADMMLMENPELALMGSCVLGMVMKGDDVYLMNVGDSRAVLAHNKSDNDSQFGKMKNDDEELLYGYEYENVHHLSSCQLTMDHSTSVKEEVRRIKNAHLDDAAAVINDRVKGSLKVTRAFGAGYLKQPKWNNALLEVFRIDYVGNSPYITCSPSLCHHKLDPNDKFLILSSDGLYQYFTNQEAVSEVEVFISTFPEGDPAQHLVEEVLFRAAKKAGMDFHELLDIPQGDRRRYHDDVSIIIISFEGRIWRSSV